MYLKVSTLVVVALISLGVYIYLKPKQVVKTDKFQNYDQLKIPFVDEIDTEPQHYNEVDFVPHKTSDLLMYCDSRRPENCNEY